MKKLLSIIYLITLLTSCNINKKASNHNNKSNNLDTNSIQKTVDTATINLNQGEMRNEMENLYGFYTDDGRLIANFDEFVPCEDLYNEMGMECPIAIKSKYPSFFISGSGPDGFGAYIVTYDPEKKRFFTNLTYLSLKESIVEDGSYNTDNDSVRFYLTKETVLGKSYLIFRGKDGKLAHVLKDSNWNSEKMEIKHGFAGEYISTSTNKKVVFDDEKYEINGWNFGSKYSFGYSIYDVRENVIKTDKIKLFYDRRSNILIFYKAIEDDQWQAGSFVDSLVPINNKYDNKGDCIYCFTQTEFLLEAEVNYYNVIDLFIMQNEILAKNGYQFENKSWYNFFTLYPWYNPTPNSYINDPENRSGVYGTNINCLKTEIEFYNYNLLENHIFNSYQSWQEGFQEWIAEEIEKITKSLKVKNN